MKTISPPETWDLLNNPTYMKSGWHITEVDKGKAIAMVYWMGELKEIKYGNTEEIVTAFMDDLVGHWEADIEHRIRPDEVVMKEASETRQIIVGPTFLIIRNKQAEEYHARYFPDMNLVEIVDKYTRNVVHLEPALNLEDAINALTSFMVAYAMERMQDVEDDSEWDWTEWLLGPIEIEPN